MFLWRVSWGEYNGAWGIGKRTLSDGNFKGRTSKAMEGKKQNHIVLILYPLILQQGWQHT